MLRINIPYTACNTEENTALSAGRQTSIHETRLGFQRHAVAQLRHLFECWLYVILLATVPFTDCGDHGEQMFSLSPVCGLINLERLGLRLHTHCLSTCLCIPVYVGPLHCCFTLKEITDVSRNLVLTTNATASLLLSKTHRFDAIKKKKGAR